LAELYGSCQALIFPGEEDFGIVPLEAHACGRPVLAYGKSGVLETVIPLKASAENDGAPTGIFFSEQTPEHLIKAVELIKGWIASLSQEKYVNTPRNFRPNVSESKFSNTSRPV
jgi:glycosyltransferase involved in cell wall biosynthesis